MCVGVKVEVCMYVLQSSFLYRSIFYLTEIDTSATFCVVVGS